MFQSTPLREGRPRMQSKAQCGQMFQSTPLREGRRCAVQVERHEFFVSIHAPARGATSSNRVYSIGGGVSIHAPARGATLPARQYAPVHNLFQSTPLREGRLEGTFSIG